MVYIKSSILSMFSLWSVISTAYGQGTVLLFQLPSSSSQIEAAKSLGKQEMVEAYQRSDRQIIHAISKDFKANYDFGDVYFFKIEDLDALKKKELMDVTFYSNDGAVISLPQSVNQYYVANISFFPKKHFETQIEGKTVIEEGVEDHLGLGIILRDKDYEPVNGKLRFTPCKIGKRGPVFNKAKRYYIFKGAELFNRKMKKYNIQ